MMLINLHLMSVEVEETKLLENRNSCKWEQQPDEGHRGKSWGIGLLAIIWRVWKVQKSSNSQAQKAPTDFFSNVLTRKN